MKYTMRKKAKRRRHQKQSGQERHARHMAKLEAKGLLKKERTRAKKSTVEAKPDPPPAPEKPTRSDADTRLLNTPLEDLFGLSGRVLNALVNNGVSTIGELATKSRDGISGMTGIGKKAMEEIDHGLRSKDLVFGMSEHRVLERLQEH